MFLNNANSFKNNNNSCLKKEVLTNNFIVVSNIYSKDKGKKIVEGNERVVNARLEDAAFFWKKDLASKLKENEKLLDRLIFHSELGTLSDKVERLKDGLAKEVVSKVDPQPPSRM